MSAEGLGAKGVGFSVQTRYNERLHLDIEQWFFPQATPVSQINVVQNWTEELKRLVPTR